MNQIHQTAIIGGDVTLGEGVEIGPYCVVRGAVKLCDGVRLVSNVSMQGPVVIGAGTVVYPGAAIGYEPQDYKFKPGTPTAGVVIGENTIIREHVTVHAASNDHTPTRIGNRTMMMVGSHAGHDVRVGDDVVIVNASLLAGHVVVQDRVTMSGSVLVHQHCRVGRQAMCSGGSVLTGDLPPYCLCAGRNMVMGLNMVGMRRSGMPSKEIEAVRLAYKRVLRHNPPLSEMKAQLDELGVNSVAVKQIADFIGEAKRPIVPVGGRKSQGRD
ncbi:MAG: acyl-ACP--UDP-N-acetylglucosamine O-acyltransferase [Phycisphaerales bacterium]